MLKGLKFLSSRNGNLFPKEDKGLNLESRYRLMGSCSIVFSDLLNEGRVPSIEFIDEVS